MKAGETPEAQPPRQRSKAVWTTIAVLLVLGLFGGGFYAYKTGLMGGVTIAPVKKCDTLAADPWDPGKKATGVKAGAIDTTAAIAACETAIGEYPKEGRFHAQLGRAYKVHGLGFEAVKAFRESIKLKSAAGMFGLADLRLKGTSVSKDVKRALPMLRRAADARHALAQYRLGWFYYKGQHLPRDTAKAAQWLTKAAVRGVPDAQYAIGLMHRRGEAVKKNSKLAFDWFLKAAKQKHMLAEFRVGQAYMRGEGVKVDHSAAIRWLTRPAKKGKHVRSQNALGVIYIAGSKKLRDHNKAWLWFRRAANQKYALAHRNIAVLYRDGVGVKANKAKALSHFILSGRFKKGIGVKQRKALETKMTLAERLVGERLADKWKSS